MKSLHGDEKKKRKSEFLTRYFIVNLPSVAIDHWPRKIPAIYKITYLYLFIFRHCNFIIHFPTLPITEVGALTVAEEPAITNLLSIISSQRVDELSTVLDSEINLASTRL